MKNFIYLSVLIFTFFKVEGQINLTASDNQKQPQTILKNEIVKVLPNKNIYVAGETLYFKIYVLSDTGYSKISKESYVYLFSPKKEKIKYIKLRLIKGVSNGDFIIPSNLKTGNYKLVAVTRLSENKPVIKNGIVDVFIVNPYDDTKIEAKGKDIILIKKLNVLPLAEEHFSKRQKVSFNIKKIGISKKGNYVVNVQKVDSVQYNKPQKNTIDNLPVPNLIPELRGELLIGKAVDKQNNPISNKIISLSITNNPNLFKNVETNKQGVFYFNLYEDYNSGNLILNTMDKKIKDSVVIKLDNKDLVFKDKLQFHNLQFHSDIKNWLESQSIYTQTENIYFKKKADSILTRDSIPKIYGKKVYTYKLDDYTRFETIKETFIEIIIKAYVRVKQGVPKFTVLLPERLDVLNAKLEALILIDGNPITDHKILFNFDPYQIKQINILDDFYFYGPMVYRGVIDVQTTKQNFELKKKQVNFKSAFSASFPNKIYYQPDYINKKEALKHIPDFRTQLYWNPNVSEKESNVSFYTSDVTGLFKIQVEGYTDNGEHVLVTKYFTVK